MEDRKQRNSLFEDIKTNEDITQQEGDKEEQIQTLSNNIQERCRKQRQPQKRYQCRQCDLETTSNFLLARHKFLVHKCRRFTCEFCNHKFSTRRKLLLHYRTHIANITQPEPKEAYGKHDERINAAVDDVQVEGLPTELSRKRNRLKNGSMKIKLVEKTPQDLKCDQCGRQFKCKKTLRRHRKLHNEKQKEHICIFCGKKYARQYQLTVHTYTHTGDRPHLCDKCGRGFRDKSTLKYHTKTMHRQEKVKCKHEGCSESFSSLGELKVHTRVHKSPRLPTLHQCPICNKSFGKLKRHMQQVHSEEKKPIKCKYCDKLYQRRKLAEEHELSHQGITFDCTTCSRSYTSSSRLKQHMKQHQDGALKCQYCDKLFASNFELKSHVASHSTERPYDCSYCGLTYKLPQHRREHEKTHLGIMYKCGSCPKTFRHEYSLKRHQKIHQPMDEHKSSRASNKIHKCSFCERRFGSKFERMSHESSHSSARPYACSICGATYKLPQHRREHEKTHQGLIYECGSCSKTFKSDYSLKRHQLVHTGLNIQKCRVCAMEFPSKYLISKHYQMNPDHNPSTSRSVVEHSEVNVEEIKDVQPVGNIEVVEVSSNYVIDNIVYLPDITD